jgi:nucleoside-diphosphate-sugar epimerase
MSAARTIGVTGATGFIGTQLVERFAADGWTVRAYQRDPSPPAPPGATRIAFRMPDRVREEDFAGLDWLIHGAVQPWSRRHRDADQVNVTTATQLIAFARAHGTRIVFLSTLSAHPEARSHYGRTKLRMESLFDPERDTVLRLGLVLGRRGGLFGSIVDTLRSARVVPLPDGGRQPIQVIAMDELVRIVARVVGQGVAGRYEIAHPEVYRMRDLYEAIMARTGAKPLLVPVPLALVGAGVSGIEALGLPFPITGENVRGLRHMAVFDTAPSLAALGVVTSGLSASVERLLDAAEKKRDAES